MLADIEFLDGAGKVIACLTDDQCVIHASLNQIISRQSVAGGQWAVIAVTLGDGPNTDEKPDPNF